MNVINTGNPSGSVTTYLSIAAGETVAEAVTVVVDGNPVNLTGYSLKMQIAFPTPLALNTGNGGITITDAAQGAFQINISDDISTLFWPGAYSFDAWMISGGGVATPLLAGLFTVTQAITVIP